MKRMIYFTYLLFLASSFLSWNPVAAEGPTPPPFELTSLEGERFTNEEMSGKVTLFIFWASWCGVCRQELPQAHLLHKKMAGRPFQIVAVGFRDSENNIQNYVKDHPDVFSFPVYYDKGDRVASQFGAVATPTLFLFDKKGQLVVPYRGGGLFEHPKFQRTLLGIL